MSGTGRIPHPAWPAADGILDRGLGRNYLPDLAELDQRGAIIVGHWTEARLDAVGLGIPLEGAALANVLARFPELLAEIRREGLRVAEIARAVDPARQRRGIGTLLGRAVLAGAAAAGFDLVLGLAWRRPDGNVPAIGSLLKLGFEPLGDAGPIYRADCDAAVFACPRRGADGCHCTADLLVWRQDASKETA